MRISRTPPAAAIAPSEWFTGSAWVEEIAVPQGPSRVRIHTVHFAPEARTVWHRHPFGQVLVVTGGAGVVQRRRGTVETMYLAEPLSV